jgi:SAM-dependent methyltransferase
MVKLAADIRVPHRALDVGCGDGKDVYFLTTLGSSVDGIDICSTAVIAAHRRIGGLPLAKRARIEREDATTAAFGYAQYDLAVCYGIYHCLDDDELALVHKKVLDAVRPGGMLALAVFNDDLPLPDYHQTQGVVLRPRDYVPNLLRTWKKINQQYGTIIEDHLPLVPQHEHALTWGLYQKPTAIY